MAPRAPQTLPKSGTEVYVADESEIVQALGLVNDESQGLYMARLHLARPHDCAQARCHSAAHVHMWNDWQRQELCYGRIG